MGTVTSGNKKTSVQSTLLKQWAVVNNAGTDDEIVWSEHWYYREALRVVELGGGTGRWDVMKRDENGRLTTEF